MVILFWYVIFKLLSLLITKKYVYLETFSFKLKDFLKLKFLLCLRLLHEKYGFEIN